jgi:ribosomal protein S18 acetylase RimI-like enzyme
MLFQAAQTSIQIRPAQESDRLQLSNLLYFEPYIHRHLDWKRPLDWLGEQPFLIAEQRGRVVAVLACPPDPPGVAWVRTFAVTNQIHPERAWNLLWQEAFRELSQQGKMKIAALCAEAWMRKLLEYSEFRQTHTVIVLAWRGPTSLVPPRYPAWPRAMLLEDLPQIFDLDWICFDALWRNSQQTIEMAFNQAVFATVIEEKGEIIGYQISTPSPRGGHLARLAVHPKMQGQGIGYTIVYDLLARFANQGAEIVTVNTQENNTASLALYRKANFEQTGHRYPVYEY